MLYDQSSIETIGRLLKASPERHCESLKGEAISVDFYVNLDGFVPLNAVINRVFSTLMDLVV